MPSLQLLYLPLINQTDIEKFQEEEADDEIDATDIILLDSDKARTSELFCTAVNHVNYYISYSK